MSPVGRVPNVASEALPASERLSPKAYTPLNPLGGGVRLSSGTNCMGETVPRAAGGTDVVAGVTGLMAAFTPSIRD
jgi:hypothetical protein